MNSCLSFVSAAAEILNAATSIGAKNLMWNSMSSSHRTPNEMEQSETHAQGLKNLLIPMQCNASRNGSSIHGCEIVRFIDMNVCCSILVK